MTGDDVTDLPQWRDCPIGPNDAEVAGAIRRLHAEGARVRDIASLLNIHPLIVTRVLGTGGER